MLKIYGSWQKYITEEDNFNFFRFLTTCGLGVVKRPPVFYAKTKFLVTAEYQNIFAKAGRTFEKG